MPYIMQVFFLVTTSRQNLMLYYATYQFTYLSCVIELSKNIFHGEEYTNFNLNIMLFKSYFSFFAKFHSYVLQKLNLNSSENHPSNCTSDEGAGRPEHQTLKATQFFQKVI